MFENPRVDYFRFFAAFFFGAAFFFAATFFFGAAFFFFAGMLLYNDRYIFLCSTAVFLFFRNETGADSSIIVQKKFYTMFF